MFVLFSAPRKEKKEIVPGHRRRRMFGVVCFCQERTKSLGVVWQYGGRKKLAAGVAAGHRSGSHLAIGHPDSTHLPKVHRPFDRLVFPCSVFCFGQATNRLSFGQTL